MLDKSLSMGYSSGEISKLEYAKTLAAALAWILIRQRDATGLAAFDETLSVNLPPRSTNMQLKAIIAALDGLSPGSATACGNAIESVAQSLSKRGLCVILSDLFDSPGTIIRGLRHLRFKRQDVIVLWILDPEELSFEKTSALRIRDCETRAELSIDGQTAGRFFRAGLERHRALILSACRELGIDLETVSTGEPFERALLRVMEKRKRLW
jgi:uncharacterized protein (DUF58 family)